MYVIIVLVALICAAVLAVQTLRREKTRDRMRIAMIGGGTSMAMIFGAYILFTLAELPFVFTALIISLGLLGLWTLIFGTRLVERTSS